jgi:hypothetical protein
MSVEKCFVEVLDAKKDSFYVYLNELGLKGHGEMAIQMKEEDEPKTIILLVGCTRDIIELSRKNEHVIKVTEDFKLKLVI